MRVTNYAFAVGLAASAAFVSVRLGSLVEHTPTVLFVAAVAVAAWRGGLGAGVVASLAAALALLYFYFDPVGSFAVASPTHLARLGLFLGASVLTSSVTASRMRTAALPSMRSEVQLGALARREQLAREERARLRHSVAELRALAGHLFDAREAERRHLAHALQSIVLPALVAMRRDLAHARCAGQGLPAELAEQLDRLDWALEPVIQTLRIMDSRMRAAPIPDRGLQIAVTSLLQEFQARTGVVSTLAVRGELPDLPPARITALLRALDEILSNVARHAAASHVTVRVQGQRRAVAVIVQDDGRGLPADARVQTTSLGLIGLRELIRHHGGWCDIRAWPGRGTQVCLSLPASSAADGTRSVPGSAVHG
jgi:signal transduction histidine kinase